MEKMMPLVPLLSHLLFVGLSYKLLNQLFDWSKWVAGDYLKQQDALRLFLLLLSLALGYLTSSFFLSVLAIGRDLAAAWS